MFCINNVFGQEIQIIPSVNGMEEFNLPSSLWSKELYELQYSKNYYIENNGNVTFTIKKKPNEHILIINDGKIIGTNYGEFGGKLIYKNDTVEYTILNDNICRIIKYGNDIFVLTGLSHGWSSWGKIIKLGQIDGKWGMIFSIDLGYAPEANIIYENNLYIALNSGIIMFDGNNIHQLIDDQFWTYLYPNTIYINENIIAVGFRGCLAIIEKDGYGIKYYK
jgi:hypothetical protein